MNNEELSILLEKYFSGTATAEQKRQLEEWYEQFDASEEDFHVGERVISASQQRSLAVIRQQLHEHKLKSVTTRRIFIRLLIAAVLCTLLAATWYFLRYRRTNRTEQPAIARLIDVAPGGNKATLTLAAGNTITLEEAATGKLASQGSTTVYKTDSGRLSYTADASVNVGSVGYNTVKTPRGGQYAVQLPDGTGVWLNAASSLRFPTRFTGSKREVELTGEAYFEVAKNASMPFHVRSVNQDIEVLGTHFNLNNYKDEGHVITTLLEGSIRLTTPTGVKILKPGQQAQTDGVGPIDVNPTADIASVMAWHDGMFYFNSVDIDKVLQQIGRWYDVDIVYNGKKPKGQYSGKIKRNTNLTEVLKILSYNGINYHLENHQLIID